MYHEHKKRKHTPISFNENRREEKAQEKEDSEEIKSSTISYCIPEILSISFMREQLLQIGLRENAFGSKSSEDYVKLFHKFITPKPQRTYPDNNKGRKLTYCRSKREKSVKYDDWNTQLMGETKTKFGLSKSSSVSHDTTCLRDKDVSHGSVVTLSKKQSSSDLDKIVINKREKKDAPADVPKKSEPELDRIVINKRKGRDDESEPKKEETSPSTVFTSRKIKLKRTSGLKQDEDSAVKEMRKSTLQESLSKKAKISWP